MKNRIALSLLAMVTTLMSFASSSYTASYLEGYWSSRGENVEIEIRSTNYGIKVKRTDKNRWYYYDNEGRESFTDQDGNRYYLDGQSILIWKNRSGRKTIRFRRIDDGRYGNRDRNDRNNRYDRYDPYDDYNDRYGNRDRYNDRNDDRYDPYRNNRNQKRNKWKGKFKTKYLEGTWYNRRSGRNISIQKRGNDSFKMNTRKGWTTFRQSHNGVFKDRRGNIVQVLNNGRLKYTICDRRGNRTMIFERGKNYRY